VELPIFKLRPSKIVGIEGDKIVCSPISKEKKKPLTIVDEKKELSITDTEEQESDISFIQLHSPKRFARQKINHTSLSTVEKNA